MEAKTWTVLVIFIGAESVFAQTDDRPQISIPEPKYESKHTGSLTLTVIDYQVSDVNRDRFASAIPELSQFLRRQKSKTIKVDIVWNELPLNDPRIMQSQLLYMTGWDAILQISETERQNLGNYLKGGGFLFADDIRKSDPDNGLAGVSPGVEGTPFDRQFKALMRDPMVLGSVGARWQKISPKHPLYTIYWDFADGPPMGGAPGGNVFDLEMLELRGRIVVVFSDLNISWYWGDNQADSERARGLQFGGNLIIFAMYQGAAGSGVRSEGLRK